MRLIAASLILSFALLAGCAPDGEQAQQNNPDGNSSALEGAAIGGPFTLINQDGEPTSWDDFKGQYRLVYFGFTYCPDICPNDLQNIARGLNQFAEADEMRAQKIQPIMISIDPERDSPQVMKQYVSAFHPRLIGLTGSTEDIADVTQKFAVYAVKTEVEGASDYNMDHSTQIFLFDPDGKPLALLPHQGGAEAFAAELAKWVK